MQTNIFIISLCILSLGLACMFAAGIIFQKWIKSDKRQRLWQALFFLGVLTMLVSFAVGYQKRLAGPDLVFAAFTYALSMPIPSTLVRITKSIATTAG